MVHETQQRTELCGQLRLVQQNVHSGIHTLLRHEERLSYCRLLGDASQVTECMSSTLGISRIGFGIAVVDVHQIYWRGRYSELILLVLIFGEFNHRRAIFPPYLQVCRDGMELLTFFHRSTEDYVNIMRYRSFPLT